MIWAELKAIVDLRKAVDSLVADLREARAAGQLEAAAGASLSAHNEAIADAAMIAGRTAVLEGIATVVELRKALETEQTMHAAWRKRAEEAEAALAATAAPKPSAGDEERARKMVLAVALCEPCDTVDAQSCGCFNEAIRALAEARREERERIESIIEP